MSVNYLNGKLYNPRNLDAEEMLYKQYFEKLLTIFDENYEIFIFKGEDFNRMLAVGVLNRHSQVGVKIYLKYACVAISDPLNASVIERAKNHFESGNSEDLLLNCP